MSSPGPNTRRPHSPWGRSVLLVLCAIVGAVLIGSLVATPDDQARRDAFAPIEWRGSAAEPAAASEIRLRLERDGQAQVVGVPRAREAEQEKNGRTYLCLEPTGEDTYTGPAEWEFVGEWGIRVRFETSSFVLRAGKSGSLLPDPDWDYPRMTECGAAMRSFSFERIGAKQ